MGSPFASAVTATIPIAFDPPHEVTVGKLAARHLVRARTAFFAEMARGLKERGGADAIKEAQSVFERPAPATPEPSPEVAPEAKAEAATAPGDPLAGLDPYWICAAGIKRWTYDRPLKPEMVELEDGTQAPRIVAILDFDEDALRWFATEIMRVTKPALFQTLEEQKEERKNA